tara:strand:- start:972 stop:1103 length:132 start_codon:yes stop_codon:yes gene_type:complete
MVLVITNNLLNDASGKLNKIGSVGNNNNKTARKIKLNMSNKCQ